MTYQRNRFITGGRQQISGWLYDALAAKQAV
jgi:hypothetical protein